MADQQQILVFPVCAGQRQLGQLTHCLHLPRQLGEGGLRQYRAELHLHLPGGGRVKGELQGDPRCQGGPLGSPLVPLRLQRRQLPLPIIDGSGGLQGASVRLLLKKLLGGDHRPGAQEAPLHLCVALEHLQGVLGCVFLLPGGGERPAVRALQPGPLRIAPVHRRLFDLQAAHPLKQPQQGLPVRLHGRQAQMLHFDDRHQPFTTPSTMRFAA